MWSKRTTFSKDDEIVCLRQMSSSNETTSWPTTIWCTLSTPIQNSTWKKTSVCDWCYYIQPLVCLLLRFRGTIIPVSGLGTRSWKWTGHRAFWISTSAPTYSAKHVNCQQTMLVNAVQLLLYGKKKSTTTTACRQRWERDAKGTEGWGVGRGVP